LRSSRCAGDVIASALANRLRVAVLGLLALLALLVASALLRVTSGAPAVAILAVFLLPLAMPLPGLWRGDPKSTAWATLCVTPYVVYGLTETIANPATRITAAAILFTSLALFGLLVAQLRVARRG
jgi:uncharacterized membrane protein